MVVGHEFKASQRQSVAKVPSAHQPAAPKPGSNEHIAIPGFRELRPGTPDVLLRCIQGQHLTALLILPTAAHLFSAPQQHCGMPAHQQQLQLHKPCVSADVVCGGAAQAAQPAEADREQVAYVRYVPPDEEDLENEIEYDLDQEDATWLMRQRGRVTRGQRAQLTDDAVEELMDRCAFTAHSCAWQMWLCKGQWAQFAMPAASP